jgi:hypothetical protein
MIKLLLLETMYYKINYRLKCDLEDRVIIELNRDLYFRTDGAIDKSPIKSLTQVVYRDYSLVVPLGVGTRIVVQTTFLRH